MVRGGDESHVRWPIACNSTTHKSSQYAAEKALVFDNLDVNDNGMDQQSINCIHVYYNY